LNKVVACCESWCEQYTIGGHPIVVLFFLQPLIRVVYALCCKVGVTLALLDVPEVMNCDGCWNSVQFLSVTLGLMVITNELLDLGMRDSVQVNISTC
jgi:hypothetical protein